MIILAELYSRIGYDPEFATDLVEGFIDDAREILSEAQAALAAGDLSELGAAGHNLKGAAQNLAVASIATPALALERAGKANDRAAAEQAIPEVIAAIEGLAVHIQTPGWADLDPEQQALYQF